jgi:hypothetical protein
MLNTVCFRFIPAIPFLFFNVCPRKGILYLHS